MLVESVELHDEKELKKRQENDKKRQSLFSNKNNENSKSLILFENNDYRFLSLLCRFFNSFIFDMLFNRDLKLLKGEYPPQKHKLRGFV